MAKRKAVTQEELDALTEVYGALEDFHKQMKEVAQKNPIVRKYFEKRLTASSKELGVLDSRIRRAELTLFRKETIAIMDAQEGEDTPTDATHS